MNELQLGLIAAGVAVLLGVVTYNAWQGSKAKRRIPRRMPVDGAGIDATAGMADDDERPFIEPTLMPARAPQADERREPTLGAAHAGEPDAAGVQGDAHAPDAHREPAWTPQAAAHANDAAAAVDDAERAQAARDDEMEAATASAVARNSAELAADDTVDAAPAAAVAAAAGANGVSSAPVAAPVATPHADAAVIGAGVPAVNGAAVPAARPAANANLPLPIVDDRIDCVVHLPLAAALPAERILPLTQRMRRAGGKAVHVEGRTDDNAHWESVRAGGRYGELRIAVQLANRAGALNEVEFSEFANAVQTLAEAVDALPEYPDMMETVGRARELDSFAAQCDAQLSVNVLSDGAPWSANYVQAVATQDGLLLSRDGMRFVKLDSRQNPVFMLQFGDTNFLRDDLTYKGGDLITLLLDVPVADEDLLPFRLMCDYAKSIGQRIGGRVVDDQRRPLSDAALQNVDRQLLTLYERLEARGLPAGSQATRRLFSQ
ncbi:Cell division protein ZipA [Pandoraea terrae]|uniref:Cell division protein ZipA n=1 Tax=Pandoraea terrae TaxID=1537710 RepID=A0A5E4WSL3_9BURK|nr:cell division protein ZipA C-terminal FtsZ-binding domain-containing protein [Pandoraea terrae]VVE26779.1 Cell division protein ZipA [Pandoraea terrae]